MFSRKPMTASRSSGISRIGNQSNRSQYLWGLGILALGFGVIGCKKEVVPEAVSIPQVEVMTITTAPVKLVTQLPGRTAAYETSEVRPQVDGLIVERLFDEGDEVREGQALYRLDSAPYLAKVESSRAALMHAKAAVPTAEALAYRYGELVKTKAISQQDSENATAQAQQARAEVLTQEAELKTAEINLRRTTIAAPISGRIGRSVVTVGGLVTAGQATALTTIQRLDPMFVDIAQPSSEFLRLRRAVMAGELSRNGDAAHVRLILEDGAPYAAEGIMKFTDVTIDSSTNTQTVRARFSNPTGLLLPGMYVRAELVEGIRTNALLVPQRAVGRDERGNGTVLVISSDNKLEARTVRTERTVGADWLVTSGLSSGDRVVIEGATGLQPGTTVKAVAWSQASAMTAATSKQVN